MRKSHKLAGQTVRIKDGVTHPQFDNFGGSEFHIEDYWDVLTGLSWMESRGNPACIIYAMRAAQNGLPVDDEVLYGKVGAFGHLVHTSEIELVES